MYVVTSHRVVCIVVYVLSSPGDYRDCKLCVWSTESYDVLCTTVTSVPQLDVCWDPYCCNEFATGGVAGSAMFWLLDETAPAGVRLNVHQTQLDPKMLYQPGKGVRRMRTRLYSASAETD